MSYNKPRPVYVTLDDLILTGDKVKPDAIKKPTLMVGFINGKPRIATYFNLFDANGDKNRNKEQTLYIIPDYNGVLIMLELAKKSFENDDDNSFQHVIQGSKFTDTGVYVPGELEMKGEIEFGKKKGICYIKITKPDTGVSATFKLKEPVRSRFNTGNSSMLISEVSKAYGLGWLDDYRTALRHEQIERAKRAEMEKRK